MRLREMKFLQKEAAVINAQRATNKTGRWHYAVSHRRQKRFTNGYPFTYWTVEVEPFCPAEHGKAVIVG